MIDVVRNLGATGSGDWLRGLAQLSAQAAVLMLLAAATVALLRRGSAAARHLVWAAALGGVLALVLTRPVIPDWKLPVLPGSWVPESVVATLATTAERPGLPQVVLVEVAPPGTGAVAATSIPAVAGDASRFRPPGASSIATLVWLAGVLLLLTRLGYGLLVTRRMAARAAPVEDADWLALADTVAARVGLRRRVPLLRAPSETVPMTWGVLRPVVLLPASANAWDDDRRAVVLLHELSHVRRRDALAHLIGQLAQAIYWFHPLVWLAVARLRVERERACDDYVLSLGERPAEYANHLLQIVGTFGRRHGAAASALAMARRSHFEGRLLAILDASTPRARVGRAAGWLAVALPVVIALPLGALSPVVRSEPTTVGDLALQTDSIDVFARRYHVQRPLAAAIWHAAHDVGIDADLGFRLVRAESEFDAQAASANGAVGLTQILHSTARRLQPGITREELFRPDVNLRLGFGYLRLLLDRYDGDVTRAIVAYHRGPSAVDASIANDESLAEDAYLVRVSAPAADPPARTPPAGRGPSAQAPAESPVPPTAPGALGAQDTFTSRLERIVARLATDGSRASVLIQAAAIPEADEALLIEVARASRHIGSSGERAGVLISLLGNSRATPRVGVEVLRAARGIESGGDLAGVLLTFLQRWSAPPALQPAFFDAIDSIESSEDRASVLLTLLSVAQLDGDGVRRLLEATRSLESDGDVASVLIHLTQRASLSEDLEDAFLDAVEHIDSDGDRESVLLAFFNSRMQKR